MDSKDTRQRLSEDVKLSIYDANVLEKYEHINHTLSRKKVVQNCIHRLHSKKKLCIHVSLCRYGSRKLQKSQRLDNESKTKTNCKSKFMQKSINSARGMFLLRSENKEYNDDYNKNNMHVVQQNCFHQKRNNLNTTCDNISHIKEEKMKKSNYKCYTDKNDNEGRTKEERHDIKKFDKVKKLEVSDNIISVDCHIQSGDDESNEDGYEYNTSSVNYRRHLENDKNKDEEGDFPQNYDESDNMVKYLFPNDLNYKDCHDYDDLNNNDRESNNNPCEYVQKNNKGQDRNDFQCKDDQIESIIEINDDDNENVLGSNNKGYKNCIAGKDNLIGNKIGNNNQDENKFKNTNNEIYTALEIDNVQNGNVLKIKDYNNENGFESIKNQNGNNLDINKDKNGYRLDSKDNQIERTNGIVKEQNNNSLQINNENNKLFIEDNEDQNNNRMEIKKINSGNSLFYNINQYERNVEITNTDISKYIIIYNTRTKNRIDKNKDQYFNRIESTDNHIGISPELKNDIHGNTSESNKYDNLNDNHIVNIKSKNENVLENTIVSIDDSLESINKPNCYTFEINNDHIWTLRQSNTIDENTDGNNSFNNNNKDENIFENTKDPRYNSLESINNEIGKVLKIDKYSNNSNPYKLIRNVEQTENVSERNEESCFESCNNYNGNNLENHKDLSKYTIENKDNQIMNSLEIVNEKNKSFFEIKENHNSNRIDGIYSQSRNKFDNNSSHEEQIRYTPEIDINHIENNIKVKNDNKEHVIESNENQLNNCILGNKNHNWDKIDNTKYQSKDSLEIIDKNTLIMFKTTNKMNENNFECTENQDSSENHLENSETQIENTFEIKNNYNEQCSKENNENFEYVVESNKDQYCNCIEGNNIQYGNDCDNNTYKDDNIFEYTKDLTDDSSSKRKKEYYKYVFLGYDDEKSLEGNNNQNGNDFENSNKKDQNNFEDTEEMSNDCLKNSNKEIENIFQIECHRKRNTVKIKDCDKDIVYESEEDQQNNCIEANNNQNRNSPYNSNKKSESILEYTKNSSTVSFESINKHIGNTLEIANNRNEYCSKEMTEYYEYIFVSNEDRYCKRLEGNNNHNENHLVNNKSKNDNILEDSKDSRNDSLKNNNNQIENTREIGNDCNENWSKIKKEDNEFDFESNNDQYCNHIEGKNNKNENKFVNNNNNDQNNLEYTIYMSDNILNNINKQFVYTPDMENDRNVNYSQIKKEDYDHVFKDYDDQQGIFIEGIDNQNANNFVNNHNMDENNVENTKDNWEKSLNRIDNQIGKSFEIGNDCKEIENCHNENIPKGKYDDFEHVYKSNKNQFSYRIEGNDNQIEYYFKKNNNKYENIFDNTKDPSDDSLEIINNEIGKILEINKDSNESSPTRKNVRYKHIFEGNDDLKNYCITGTNNQNRKHSVTNDNNVIINFRQMEKNDYQHENFIITNTNYHGESRWNEVPFTEYSDKSLIRSQSHLSQINCKGNVWCMLKSSIFSIWKNIRNLISSRNCRESKQKNTQRIILNILFQLCHYFKKKFIYLGTPNTYYNQNEENRILSYKPTICSTDFYMYRVQNLKS